MIRRKDSQGRVLKDGETEIRVDGKTTRYTYRYKTKSGKRKQIYAKSLEELRVKEDEIQKATYDGIRIEDSNITINTYFDKWSKTKVGLKANTFNNYVYMYKKYVYDDFGKIKLVDLVKSDIKEFYTSLNKEKHLAISTIDAVHTCLIQVIQFAVDDGLIRDNPANFAMKDLKRKKIIEDETSKKKNEALTIEEEKIFMDYLKNTPQEYCWYPIFGFMLATGLRVGEVTGLTENDIDYNNNTITISHTLVYFDKYSEDRTCTYEIHSPKTDSSNRVIPLTPEAKYYLDIQKQYLADAGIKSRMVLGKYGEYKNFIFVNRFGDVLNQGTLNKALRRIIKYCNAKLVTKGSKILLPKFSCHCTRHTFATRMYEAGVPHLALKAILGHRPDSEVTDQIYVESTADYNREQMQKYIEYRNRINKKDAN